MTPDYGAGQFPVMAVDPLGRWVAQAGIVHPYGKPPRFDFNLYELRGENVVFLATHGIELTSVTSADISSNIRALAFNADGSALWVSLGSRPNQGPFATWLARVDTSDWRATVFGPVAPFQYHSGTYSRYLFNRVQPVTINGQERVVAPVEPLGSLGFDTLAVFDPSQPGALEEWKVDYKPPGHPNFLVRTTDVLVLGDAVYSIGWVENVGLAGERSPRASVTAARLTDRSLVAGPLWFPELAGIADFENRRLAELRGRFSPDGSALWLVAPQAVWPPDGNPNANRSGFVRVDLAGGTATVRTDFPRTPDYSEFEIVRDVFEAGGTPYLLRLVRRPGRGEWTELVGLDAELRPAAVVWTSPADWSREVYAAPHPRRSGDVILSAGKRGDHPNMPRGVITLFATPAP